MAVDDTSEPGDGGNTTPAHALATTIGDYLRHHATHRSRVTERGPLRRPVRVYWQTWLPWLRDGGRPGRRSSYRLPPEHSAAALALLEDPRLRASAKTPGTLSIDRPLLGALARGAWASDDPAALIQLFVATMMWGSGTSYSRGPWRTAQALSSTELPRVLRDTRTVVREAVQFDDLADAHRAFSIGGIRESFFTKWFWAVSLGGDVKLRPLILDDRVRTVLHRMLRRHPAWRVPKGGAGYARYVATLHEAADLLPEEFADVDAEKMEWLMFDRSNHEDIGERCLNDDLAESQAEPR